MVMFVELLILNTETFKFRQAAFKPVSKMLPLNSAL